MTEWLDISLYPYDGTPWALFKGGKLVVMPVPPIDDSDFDPPCVVGRGDGWCCVNGQWKLDGVQIADYGHGFITYINPTHWLPLSILDTIEPHHITAARLML